MHPARRHAAACLGASGLDGGARAGAGPLGAGGASGGADADGGRCDGHDRPFPHARSLPDECRRADIVVAAVGRPELVRGDWLTPGAVVIDVGNNRLPDGRLVGRRRISGMRCHGVGNHAGAGWALAP